VASCSSDVMLPLCPDGRNGLARVCHGAGRDTIWGQGREPVRVLDAENRAPVPTIAVTSRDDRFLESTDVRFAPRPGLTKPHQRNSNARPHELKRQVSENDGEQVQTLVAKVKSSPGSAPPMSQLGQSGHSEGASLTSGLPQ
jgi:hypothetical protein